MTDFRVERGASTATGDVAGPGSSTDNAIVRFDGTTGKVIQNSGVTISDSNLVLAPTTGGFSAPGGGTISERFGSGAVAQGTGSVAIGNTADGTGNNSVVIGANAASNQADVVALGTSAAPVVGSSFVCGSQDNPINTVSFGQGYRNFFAASWVLAGVHGFGTNRSGADLKLSAGRSTGTATGKDITFHSSAISGSSGTLNSEVTIARIKNNQGIEQTLSGAIFTQTADQSVTNTTTETSIVGSGVGTLTLPANFFTAGKTIRIIMSGVYSTVAVTGDTVTVKIKYGSTVLASKATSSLLTGATNAAWFADVLVTCRSTGATGTVQVSGGIRYQVASSAIVEDELNNSVGTTTLDTTSSNLFDVTVTHGAANSSNTVKSLVGAFEVLN